ncbi:MAG: GntR family transcriptional regulator [Pseudomonadota bacterium]
MAQHRFAPVERKPAYAQVFESIENEILSGRLEDGAAMPTEMELCRQFGVQRSTVREGVRLLEQSGLVRRVNGKRLVVARPRIDEAAENTRRGLERFGARFIDVWEAISTILTATARLAADKVGEDDLAALAQITRDLTEARDEAEVVANAVSYIQQFGAATGNEIIAVLVRSLSLLTKASLERVINDLPRARKRIEQAQREINAALKDGDQERAMRWVERHVDDLKRGYDYAGVDLETEVGMFGR